MNINGQQVTTHGPVIHQRCHADGIGFGTIHEIRGNRLRILFDADNGRLDGMGKTRWKNLDEVELVPVQDNDPLAPGYPEDDSAEWDL